MEQSDCMNNLDESLIEDIDDFHNRLTRIHKIKSIYVRRFTGEDLSSQINVNNKQYCITNLPKDLEWLEKTICFTKSFSDYLVFSNGSNCAIPMQNCPLDICENNQTNITENAPFMKYKVSIKEKYSMLIHVLKELYNTALEIPDAEKIRTTILNDFHIDNDIHLKHPEFIMDYFFYHIYNHVHITKHYEEILGILKVFEYIYYKVINYVNELEFDAEYIKPFFEIY